ncbi:MAG: rhodanese-related sulfurtransferase [Bacteroidales bacterium]|nr:rhodanese-related sulfurtransferase [Bacteroidales bacterium]
MTPLHNRVNKEILKQRLADEPFNRTTLSFYRYVIIDQPQAFRDELYTQLDELNCFGRIYVAREGINAQMSVPTENLKPFLELLEKNEYLKNMPIKYAVEDDGKSFYKLIVRLKNRILADGLDDNAYDVTNVGKHLTALEFHELAAKEETLVIDMRNHYESEIGHFENAVCPEADTFREEIQMVTEEFKDQKDRKILLYCTGGIRCEKASAYFKHLGFRDVNQLHGGVIEYAQQIKKAGLQSRYIGKNFVFDNRMCESIDHRVVGKCHQCGAPADTHINCANDACHLLFIQCAACAEKYDHCCSVECQEFIELPVETQRVLRKEMVFNGTINGYKGLRERLSAI